MAGLLFLGMGVLALAAGCGFATAEDTAPAQIPIELVRVVSDDQMTTPALAFLPTRDEARQILRAYDVLLADCVSKSGHEFGGDESNRPSWILEIATSFEGTQPLGPVDPERMARYGYHDPAVDEPVNQPEQALSPPAPQPVINRCDRMIQKSWGEPPVDLAPLILEAGRRAKRDPRGVAASQRWVECMKDRGFDYESESGPVLAFALNGGTNATDLPISTPKPSAREIEVAKADAGCQRKSRNIDTRVALLKAYEQAALDARPEFVSDYERYWAQLLDASDRVLDQAAEDDPA